jgi:hypothetical protein
MTECDGMNCKNNDTQNSWIVKPVVNSILKSLWILWCTETLVSTVTQTRPHTPNFEYLWNCLNIFNYITCQSMEQTAGVPFEPRRRVLLRQHRPMRALFGTRHSHDHLSIDQVGWVFTTLLYKECTKSNKSKSCWEAPTSGTPPSARACHTLTRLAHKLQLVRTMQNWDTRNGSGWLELRFFWNETLGWIVHHWLSINLSLLPERQRGVQIHSFREQKTDF